ncbi:hypothetical protein BD560DRAFT_395612 [Blakeslea trispora]|nr:hypothetical protein BD560DRAFT_395612 [Blakeslea trispora]
MSCSSSTTKIQLEKMDHLLSELPLFYSESSSTKLNQPPSSFRTTTLVNPYDPELYMGDDSDASYEQALMQSGLFSQPCTSIFQTIIPHQRLEMLLRHFQPSS